MWCPWKTVFSNKCVCMYLIQYTFLKASYVVIVVKNLPTNAGYLRDMDLIPGSGRHPKEGHGNPLQYSCLENPMDRGAWRLQFMGSQRVRHNWSDLAHTHTFLQIRDWHTFIRWFSSGQFSCSVMSDSLWLQELQHTRLSWPSSSGGGSLLPTFETDGLL